MPSNEKMTMNKNKSNKRDAMDWIEFNNDATKLESECQYLKTDKDMVINQFMDNMGTTKKMAVIVYRRIDSIFFGCKHKNLLGHFEHTE